MSRALDVFDHNSVPNVMARAARAGFAALPDCRVSSFIVSGGKYRATFTLTPKGAPIALEADTLAELLNTAVRLHTDIQTGQEAA